MQTLLAGNCFKITPFPFMERRRKIFSTVSHQGRKIKSYKKCYKCFLFFFVSLYLNVLQCFKRCSSSLRVYKKNRIAVADFKNIRIWIPAYQLRENHLTQPRSKHLHKSPTDPAEIPSANRTYSFSASHSKHFCILLKRLFTIGSLSCSR